MSVVVPVYNSEATLTELVMRLTAVLDRVARAHEVILVDDGSSDGSWSVILQLEQQFGTRGLRLMRNYGQHNALLAGIRAASYDVIVTLDDDLQNPPEEIPALLEGLTGGYRVVYGTPRKGQYAPGRGVATLITKMVVRHLLGFSAIKTISSFRAFHTELRDAFASYEGSFVSIDILLTWGTTRFGAVAVDHHPRAVGKSQYSYGRLIRHTIDMISSFSERPLQFASFLGLSAVVFGIAVLCYALGHFIFSPHTVEGFTFLASIIAIFAGIQLFVQGITGEYVSRIHFRVMDKPTYVLWSRKE